ncbi:MAG TPA: bifunctional serine/threonine-protein kinase/formylglycine-generating enzyme family protein [Rhodanobacteraceae bacterium]|nr:bifunctional serine/threonine-protein kinase/formylglycine-generating enzyme family protein [Rhodanobacteraceae bacterium]
MGLSAPVVEFEVPGHRLVRPLGRGGMATVYLAIQSSLGRPVAVKILQAATDETITRFEQEARTIARLQHPHIVAIYEVGRTSDGQLYYTMPYLPNGDLSKVDLRDSPSRIAAVIRALAGALGHAHKHGIVHRDVKPENVLFDQHRRALLTDFGIARASDSLRVTREGATMGSSGYMSPEQARGQDIDGRSDLYSLGVVCYELLTGDLPFRGADALSTAIAHIEQPVPRLPPLKRAWQPLVDKALAKSPDARFQNAEEMIAALDAVDGRRTSPRPVVAPKPQRPKLRMPRLSLPRFTLPRFTLPRLALPCIQLPPPQTLRRYGPPLLVLLGFIAVSAAAWSWRSHSKHAASQAAPAARQAAVTGDSATATPAAIPAAMIKVDATRPQIALPVEASSVDAAQTARVTVLLAQADALFVRGHLTEPRKNSAAMRYLDVLTVEPENPAAHAGIGKIVAVLQQDTLKAWRRSDTDQVKTLVGKLDALAPSADPASQKSWRAARRQLAQSLGTSLADAAQSHDEKRVAALRPLAESLPAIYPDGFNLKQLDTAPPAPPALHAGSPLRDEGGPSLVYVPADGKADAFAIGRTDVTRAEYAQFVRDTHRAASSCAEPYHPFSRLRGFKWNDPGFAQGGDHPVVCVSWNDAAAYAAWLSRRTGQPYRLPTDGEWLRAARGGGNGSACARGNVDDSSRQTKFDNDRWPCSDGAAQTSPVGRYAASGVGAYGMYGNVSQWLSGGSAGNRIFRGLSWRDGSHETALGRRGTADSNIGYTSVGFRVMRVIDDAHPAPNG